MKQFLFYILIFCIYNSQAQYQDPVEIYKDILDSDITHIHQNFLLNEIDEQGFKDILAIQVINEEELNIGSFNQEEENTFQTFDVILPINESIKKENIFFEDFNGDSKNDIVYISNGNNLNILYSLGNGDYDSPQTSILSPIVTDRLFRINAVGDLDNDGDNDLVLTHFKNLVPLEDSSEIYLAINDGLGNFTTEIIPNEFASSYNNVLIGDIDGDLDLDIVTVGFGGINYSLIEVSWYEEPFYKWYQNDGLGDFSEPFYLDLPQRSERLPAVSNIQLADLEGDGDLDVFASFAILDSCIDQIHNFGCAFIYVYSIWKYNESDNNLIQINELNSWPHDYLIDNDWNYYEDFFDPVYADYNSDGNIDILTTNTITNEIFWRVGDGTGLFDNESFVDHLNDLEIRPKFKDADMDNDGDLDIVSLLNSDSISLLQYYQNGQSSIVDFDEDGFTSDIDCDDTDSLVGSVLPFLYYEEAIVTCEHSDLMFEANNELLTAEYHWFGPNNFTANVSEPVIENMIEADAGIYSVYATLNQCTSDTNEIDIVVSELPPVFLEFTNDSLIANIVEYSSYHWYLDGNLINEIINEIYIPTVSGYYQVEIVDDLQCSNISDSLQVNIVGLNQNTINQVKLYPNPISKYKTTTIQLNENIQYPTTVSVYNVNGVKVYSTETSSLNTIVIESNTLEVGMYIVSIQSKEEFSVSQLMIVN